LDAGIIVGEAMEEPAETKMAGLIGTMPMQLGPSIFKIGRKAFALLALQRNRGHTKTIPEMGVDLH
jgi:hypothetical protein